MPGDGTKRRQSRTKGGAESRRTSAPKRHGGGGKTRSTRRKTLWPQVWAFLLWSRDYRHRRRKFFTVPEGFAMVREHRKKAKRNTTRPGAWGGGEAVTGGESICWLFRTTSKKQVGEEHTQKKISGLSRRRGGAIETRKKS